MVALSTQKNTASGRQLWALSNSPKSPLSRFSCKFPSVYLDSFEDVGVGGFEQLCKNYALEKIRGKFFQDEVDICRYAKGKGGALHQGRKSAWAGEATSQMERSREMLTMLEGKGSTEYRSRCRS